MTNGPPPAATTPEPESGRAELKFARKFTATAACKPVRSNARLAAGQSEDLPSADTNEAGNGSKLMVRGKQLSMR